jgi:hypothetical protein
MPFSNEMGFVGNVVTCLGVSSLRAAQSAYRSFELLPLEIGQVYVSPSPKFSLVKWWLISTENGVSLVKDWRLKRRLDSPGM